MRLSKISMALAVVAGLKKQDYELKLDDKKNFKKLDKHTKKMYRG